MTSATRVRWFPILALVAIATMINYLDRTILGIAAPYLTKDLGLTATAMGVVFSAFSWSYALLQIPGGVFLDRFGTRVTYSLALTLWSVCTAIMGLVNNLTTLVATRIGVGIFEAPCFPANSRVLATWFPQTERARANSIYSVGQYAGIAFLSVPLFWITQQFGWRGLFFLAGGLGIALGILMWSYYREPSESPSVNSAEMTLIEAGGGGEYKGERLKFSWAHVGTLLRRRQVLGASLGQFGGNSTQVFFVTWFPTYLVNVRGMDFINAGLWTALPYIGASIGVLVGQPRAEDSHRRGSAARLDYRGRQLCSPGVGRCPDRDHVGRVLWPRHDQSRLDGDFRCGAEETDWADGRHLQLQRQPGRYRHADRRRRCVSGDRFVLSAPFLHWHRGSSRRARVRCRAW
jgi:ACS family D-galactonate transporter-like MFS transporter